MIKYQVRRDRFSVSAGETVAGVDFDLIVGGTITGSVTDGAGKPIAQQAVMLTSVSTQPNPTLYVINPALIPFTSGYFRTDDLGFIVSMAFLLDRISFQLGYISLPS